MNLKENKNDGDIDFKDLFRALWNGKWVILSITTIASILVVIYALSLPNIYKSSTLLAPASSSNSSLSGLASQYSDMASLAGISIPSSGEADKVSIGLEVLKSYDFFEKIMSKDNLFFKLVAPSGWNAANNTLIIDPEIYNMQTQKWVSKAMFATNGKPSMQSSYRQFTSDFSVAKDSKTGFITLSFNHYSPHVAKEFLDIIILETNELARAEDIAIAKDTISYLQEEASKVQLSMVKNGINNMIQRQVETISIATATPQYLFKILSKPLVSERKSQPGRAFICIIGFLFGVISSIFLVLVRHYFFRQNQTT